MKQVEIRITAHVPSGERCTGCQYLCLKGRQGQLFKGKGKNIMYCELFRYFIKSDKKKLEICKVSEVKQNG